MNDWYQWRGDDLVLRVWAQPRASRDQIVGLQHNYLKIKVTSPPADGQANARIGKLLASVLGVPGSSVALTGGASSRKKTFLIKNLARKLPAGEAPAVLLPEA